MIRKRRMLCGVDWVVCELIMLTHGTVQVDAERICSKWRLHLPLPWRLHLLLPWTTALAVAMTTALAVAEPPVINRIPSLHDAFSWMIQWMFPVILRQTEIVVFCVPLRGFAWLLASFEEQFCNVMRICTLLASVCALCTYNIPMWLTCLPNHTEIYAYTFINNVCESILEAMLSSYLNCAIVYLHIMLHDLQLIWMVWVCQS